MKHIKALLLAAVVALGTACGVAAYTPAGTEIKAVAECVYADAAGNAYTATSQAAIVTVVERVFSMDLKPDRTGVAVTGKQGEVVYVPVAIVNEADAPDACSMSVLNAPVGYAVKFIRDVNGNGVRDAEDVEEYTTTEWIAGGNTKGGYGFAAIAIPSDAAVGTQVNITIQSASVLNPAVVDWFVLRVTPESGGVIEPMPKLVVSAGMSVSTAKPGELVTMTVVVKNEGGAVAKGAVVEVDIPAGTVVVSTDPDAEVAGGLVKLALPDIAPAAEQIIQIVFRVM